MTMPRQSLLEYFQPNSRPASEAAIVWRRGYRMVRWSLCAICSRLRPVFARWLRSSWRAQRRPSSLVGRKFRRMGRRVSRMHILRRRGRADGRDCGQGVRAARGAAGRRACGRRRARSAGSIDVPAALIRSGGLRERWRIRRIPRRRFESRAARRSRRNRIHVRHHRRTARRRADPRKYPRESRADRKRN